SAEPLWALYVGGGFDETLAKDLLAHPNEDVRMWAIRLQGDTKKIGSAFRDALVALAKTEPSPYVRAQMACTAKRLPAADAFPIVRELLQRADDANDLQIPLLLWWAIEDKALSDRDLVLGLLDTPESWKAPITRKTIVERMARRYAVEGDYAACAKLIADAPGKDFQDLLVVGLDKAFEGRRLETMPAPLAAPVAALLKAEPAGATLLSVAIRLGSADAYADALRILGRKNLKESDATTLIPLLGQIGSADCLPVLLSFLQSGSTAVKGAALAALQPFQDPAVAPAVIKALPGLGGAHRARALSLLTARAPSSLLLVQAVAAGALKPSDIPVAELQRMAAFENAELHALLLKHWGKVGAPTPGEKLAQLHSIRNIMGKNPGGGDRARGKAIFTKSCAVCHTLWGEGNKIGPDITTADRKNLDVLAMNIIEPSAVIRMEYGATQVLTTDGQVLVGLVVEQSEGALTLLDANNNKTVVPKSRIQISKASALSLMPEKLMDPLTDQEILDFFAYLQGDTPLAAAPAPKADVLPGTAPLDKQGDLSAEMVAGIDRFLLREIEGSVEKRAAFWKRDTSTKDAYEKSVAPNRERLKRILGIVDERAKDAVPEFPIPANQAGFGFALATSDAFQVRSLRWPVLRGIEGEGLLLIPKEASGPFTIVFPDADQTPEMMAGITPGIPEEQQIARRLAEAGCFVLVPTVIDRADTWSASQIGRTTNQPHREFVYRPAFGMGRTIIGYEIQKALAFIDFVHRPERTTPIGVFGIGEGGLLALYAGAVDPRIDVTWVGGYFESRQKAWEE
ncbi:MAG: hypothetical protein EHM91_07640, partial [Planctomycetota bacterium]